MIWVRNQEIHGNVFDVKPSDNGKYCDFRFTTYDKVKSADGSVEYRHSYWNARAVTADAIGILRLMKDKDRLTINECRFTNEMYTDKDGNKRTFLRLIVVKCKPGEYKETRGTEPASDIAETVVTDEEDDEDTPF